MEGAEPSRRGGMESRRSRSFSWLLGGHPGTSEGARARLGEFEDEEGEESVEEGTPGPNLAPTNKPLVPKSDTSLPKIMEQMATIMGQLSQSAASRDDSKALTFKTSSLKAPISFAGTQAHKLRGFIKSCQLIFHNDPANLFSDRNKALYLTSFLTGRDGKWIESYLSNISNEDPSYLLNNWQLFETQLFTLFGYANEVRKAEQELKNLRIRKVVMYPSTLLISEA
ncbi:hypothetical protein O181_042440 [Austropuccinia psidii MF-1]|uniref:Retrotransposon gag domain-containing protein n=1 Tax=Austropuccinia psidii MF-1 TaxID=1389203 RepID=A0A9Q3DGN1_9BASI|nr:hypothetical protein [Austropuccinia psidii MF-1]